MKSVCVYCGSSTQVDKTFFEVAARLGKILAENGITLVYGGGSLGLMGEIARSTLEAGGKVTGVIPRFMYEEDWYLPGLTELIIVETMHERKNKMAEIADGFVALPGGCGTMEELLEIITWKQLGLVTQPIVIVNTNGYYKPLLEMFSLSVEKNFMRDRHLQMWQQVQYAEDILPALQQSVKWDKSYRKFAAI